LFLRRMVEVVFEVLSRAIPIGPQVLEIAFSYRAIGLHYAARET